ncbi:hypothetical protein L208DRAFT_501375 [Tricholoma matsutake]|nr:hypothetical protein L208DRAFT_501375 [Tricholoma matsutake 945]
MPFDRYLHGHSSNGNSNDNPNGNHTTGGNLSGSVSFSPAFGFQVPPFIYAGAPILAPGGGAEVLPFSPSASAWFTNNGFTGSFTKPSFEHHPFPSSIAGGQPFPFLPQAHPITAPSSLGLPVYSASGFDLLSILSRVATRPSPRISLGPVDLTCSFVVVDVRRHDHPIVYCSPSFCSLTGYPEIEVLGRNCRFLQAPPTVGVRRGDERIYTDGERVKSMKKMLAADKECQISIVNYRRDSSAFCNLITVIPIGGGEVGQGGENDIVYHVGFQVDLGEQPSAILQRLKEGSYAGVGVVPPIQQQIALTRDSSVSALANIKKGLVIPPLVMSKTLKKLLNNPKFIASFPISTSTTVPAPLPASTSSAHENNPLSLILLEYSSDFVHVVSLKGAFLYVAPSVRRVLGWEPEDLVGKSVADLAHPEDVVPLMRELKEGSAATVGAGIGEKISGETLTVVSANNDTKASGSSAGATTAGPRIVDMLYRARTKAGRYVWVESRGRLHVEPGKGRKAIVLSGRAREMGNVSWCAIAESGMCKPAYVNVITVEQTGKADKGKGTEIEIENENENESTVKVVRREFWAMASGSGSTSFLTVGSGVADVLGWTAEELIGRRVGALVVGVDGNADGEAVRVLQRGSVEDEVREVRCAMARKDGRMADVAVVFYPSTNTKAKDATEKLYVSPAPVIVQVKLLDSSTSSFSPYVVSPTSRSGSSGAASSSSLVHPLDANIFEELEIPRGTSWQYELEKLRFANARLEQEIERLEGIVGGAGGDIGGVCGDNADDTVESDKGNGSSGHAQHHVYPDLDGPSPGEFQQSVQQQQDPYEQEYQVHPQPQYHEQQPQNQSQETPAPCRYAYPQPQRRHSQSQLHVQKPQQHQGMYATTPLQAPAAQTMTLPPVLVLQHQNHNEYTGHIHHSQYHEYEDLDREHQRKRLRQSQSQSESQVHMGARPEAQLPSRMTGASVMGYYQASPMLSQVGLPTSQPSMSMQEWVQRQQRYVPQSRGSKRSWPDHEQ